MGKQVRFRCTAGDAAELQRLIESLGPVVYLAAARLDSPTPVLGQDLSRAKFVMRAEDARLLETTPMPECWVISQMKNPVIEYSAGHLPDGQPYPRGDVRHGRLYFDAGPWQGRADGQEAPPAGFSAWADNVLRLVRERWTRAGDAYEGPQAHVMLDGG